MEQAWKLSEMRRQDRKLTEAETLDVVRTAEFGVLATVSRDGFPYSVPLSFAWDEERGALYLHCSAAGGQKIENLQGNPRACFTMVADTGLMPEQFATKYRSANVFGRIRIVTDAAEKRHGIEAILKKYAGAFEEKGMRYIDGAIDRIYVLRMNMEQITGKARKK